MRIAFYHELHQGGARRAVNELAKELQKKHTVDFYLVDENLNKDEIKEINNYFLYKFHTVNWRGGNWKQKLYKDSLELLRLYNLHKKIAKEINNNKYDLVFVHPSRFTQSPFILRFVTSKKIYYCQEPLRIVYEEGLGIERNLNILKITYEKLNRLIRKKIDTTNIKSADVVIANSKFTKQNILNAYNIESKVIYLGVDSLVFSPKNTKKDIDILYLGSKDSVDGFDLLEESIKKISFKLNIKIVFSGKNWNITDNALCDMYRRSKTVVCLTYNEPFGLIPLEAMACATPVVAVNEGGYRETVEDGKNGFLVSRNPEELAKKIEWIIKNESRSIKLGRSARDMVSRDWTWKKSADKIEKICKDLIKEKENEQ